MTNSSDTIRNQTRDLPTCSTVPQRTALPRASYLANTKKYVLSRICSSIYVPLLQNYCLHASVFIVNGSEQRYTSCKFESINHDR